MAKAPQPIIDDEEDDDESPQRGGIVFRVLLFFTAFAWMLLLVGVMLGLVLFFAALGRAQNVMQEASISATFLALVVSAYVFVRCLDRLTSISRLQ